MDTAPDAPGANVKAKIVAYDGGDVCLNEEKGIFLREADYPYLKNHAGKHLIVSNDGAYVYGIAVAEDCGGDIKGDRMDLYFPTFDECIQFGRRVCTIYFLD